MNEFDLYRVSARHDLQIGQLFHQLKCLGDQVTECCGAGGITVELDPVFGASVAFNITDVNVTHWNLAYAWGNHSVAGYLTEDMATVTYYPLTNPAGYISSYTETDPIYTASTWFTTPNNSGNWNAAFGWGNHALAGYLTDAPIDGTTYGRKNGAWVVAGGGGGGPESDPIFTASPAAGISGTNISNWNTAFGWGNHALAGYLTSFTEVDPIFMASAASGITGGNITNWNSAFGWGNHALAGYLTSFTETDPVFNTWLSGSPLASYLTTATAAATYSVLGHTHAYSSLTGLPTLFTQADADLLYSVLGHTHTFASLTSKPSTLAGYNITDAYPLTGNPSGFLTSFTESDPVFAAWLATPPDISTFNNDVGYLTNTDLTPYLTITSAAATYSVLGHTHTFASLTSKPSTLAGYTITDAYPLTGNPSGFLVASALTPYLTSATAASTYAALAVSNNYTAGAKQKFQASASTAGFALGGVTVDPSGLATGDLWFRTDTQKFRYYDGATTRSFVTEQLAQTLTNKTLTSPIISNATASTVAVYNASKELGSSAVTATEIGYVAGVTSAIQTQLNTKVSDIMNNMWAALGATVVPKVNSLGLGIQFISSSAVLASTNMRIVPVWIEATTTITGAMFYLATAGIYTASNYNGVILFSYSGGTCTQVAATLNDGNAWKSGASNNYSALNFTSSYVAAPGIYFIGLLYSTSAQTTAPAIGIYPNFANTAVSSGIFANSAKLAGVINGQTSAPASFAMSGVTASAGNLYWVSLY